MSIAAIRAALESRLNGMSPALATAWENMHYAPTIGTPWQRVRLLINDPVDLAIGRDVLEQRGIFEVLLHYPHGAGSATAIARAQAVASRFAPVQRLTSGSTNVEILSTARIASALTLDDWYVIPVSVPWRSFSTS